ncbi:MAG TPA: protein-L-isoaspartate O-methyltransferase [Burkholderiales bacterium]|nr:protein-L-isoaspartate O-methyltransferase [Burkholderiales bacterium]
MNLDQARFNMVEQQIRTWEVLDQQVLDLLFELRREEFVPSNARSLAFVDMEIPLGHGEVMLSPKLEARMLQELGVKSTDKALEIGSGSGYMTALLARRAAFVDSVEIIPELSAFAAKNLAAHGVENVKLHVGDGAQGWSGGPYDVIVLTGSTPVLPPAFLKMLKPGGRLLAVIGDAPVMKATLFTAAEKGAIGSVELFETCISPLRNALQPKRFVF